MKSKLEDLCKVLGSVVSGTTPVRVRGQRVSERAAGTFKDQSVTQNKVHRSEKSRHDLPPIQSLGRVNTSVRMDRVSWLLGTTSAGVDCQPLRHNAPSCPASFFRPIRSEKFMSVIPKGEKERYTNSRTPRRLPGVVTGSLVDLAVSIHDDPRTRLAVEISSRSFVPNTPHDPSSSLSLVVDDIGPTSD